MSSDNHDNTTNPAKVQVNDKKTVFQGFFRVDEWHIQHELFAGGMSGEFTREIFERGDAAILLPYDVKQDKVLLVEQFRAGAVRENQQAWLLEPVAGMIEEGETPESVAIREAEEESGLDLTPENLIYIMEYFSSPGGTSEKLYLYLGLCSLSEELGGKLHGLDYENEDIRTHVVSRQQALEWLQQGRITNASTIIALQWLALNYQKLSA
ncbi:NUDIX domain-containing protein [Thalassotalea sp. PS06]|uniref:NUDIX domain-containing protein n=1 Tax=Thalassotalea sp. PS06 TaxID=2594005 RepID=UPI001162C835|nr:NUDIX domain-containing protein [Thalassotalea sp. PS06]QDP02260.1 NUDIX domain-containing protein [Thalassotalea sp. PS06]